MNIKLRKKILYLLSMVFVIFSFCVWQNNDIVITHYKYHNEKIPTQFHNYKILQISDLHNKEFGKNQTRLIEHSKKIQPDIIVITGDLIDRDHTSIEDAMDYIDEAIKIAPIFYVSGNHEHWSGVYDILFSKLKSSGVKILDNESINLQLDHNQIQLLGIDDPTFLTSQDISQLVHPKSFNLLLSHRPERFQEYITSNVDLVLTGHAHGGQFRIPFGGGIIAPNQGLFPKYTNGIHKKEHTTMIVNRGLGNSIVPIRIFNRPELVVVTLKSN